MYLTLVSFFLWLNPGPIHAFPQQEDNYYPLSIGSSWSYIVQDKKVELTVCVARKEKVGETECFVVETMKNDKLVASEHLAIVGKGVFRLRLSDLVITPPLPFARTELQSGDSWNAAYSIVADNKKIETRVAFTVTKEKVKVHAGEFEAMKVVSAIDNGGSTLWLVKGIGPVKIQFDLGQGDKAVLELKTMTLTK